MAKKLDKLDDEDKWLAAEYALGVLDGHGLKRAGAKYDRELAFRGEVDAWQNQLEALIDEVMPQSPSPAVWRGIEGALFSPKFTVGDDQTTNGSQNSFWKLVTALMSTVAVACFGMLMYFTNGDFAGQEKQDLQRQLAELGTRLEASEALVTQADKRREELSGQASALRQQLETVRITLAQASSDRDAVADRLVLLETQLGETSEALSRAQLREDSGERQIVELEQRLEAVSADLELARQNATAAQNRLVAVSEQVRELTSARDATAAQIANLQAEVADKQAGFEQATARLEDLNRRIVQSRPLVASLSQAGNVPAFVAQYDPLRQALFIRTALENEDEKVPEIWLIPGEGNRKGEVLSLGVMDETRPDEVKISGELLPLIGEEATLAITMEPVGGAPNGVATGPVIAVGKLQGF